jgi:hypothetical protein
MNQILRSISKYVDQFYRFQIDQELAFTTLRDSLSTGQVISKVKIIEVCRDFKLQAKKRRIYRSLAWFATTHDEK